MAGVVRCAARLTIINSNVLLMQTSKSLPCIMQTANISSKAWRDLNNIKRPPPYDYKNKDYTLTKSWFDKTSHRIDENSKIILVEGPIAAGKEAFGKQLAADLDMHFIPPARMDDVYINDYGFDLRTLDDKLPPGARSFDTKKFLADPKNRLTASFQMNMFGLKFVDYMDSLAHLFSTGQGVVLSRSPYSDIIFLEALYRHNLITKTSYKGLLEIRNASIYELLKPHLVIYLDVPTNVTLDRIKARNKDGEANSVLFKDEKFLETLDEVYKQDFLKNISTHAEILVYDWTNGGESDLVVEDIERIDFDRFEKEETKMRDWRFFPLESDWNEARMKYTSDRDITSSYLELPLFHCPDLCIGPEDNDARLVAYENAPGEKYAYGYNKDMGDDVSLMKDTHYQNPKSKSWEY